MSELGTLRVYVLKDFVSAGKTIRRNVLLQTVHCVSVEQCIDVVKAARSENPGEFIIGQFSVAFS